MNRRRNILCCLLLVVSLGCQRAEFPESVLKTLQSAEQYELYSLDPVEPETPLPEDTVEKFHDWKVLGKTSITDPTIRAKLNEALQHGAKKADGTAAACFWPRHGIRVTQANQAIDYVICFQCASILVFEGEKNTSGFPILKTPQPAFDEVLRNANVPLPRQ